jgi:RimJ/RimL family protein N-acetyltransferase
MLHTPPRAEIHASPLQGQRAVLRPVDESDAPDIWNAVNSSREWLQPWLPWVPYQQNPESAERFAQASVADWDQGRALRFIIRAQSDGRMAGIVGLEACVPMHRSCELGYWLKRDAARQGLMTDAAGVCVGFGFHRMKAHRIRVAAATGNHPSLRVIARLGFRFEGVARHAEWCDGRWLDHAVFGLLEDEWTTS